MKGAILSFAHMHAFSYIECLKRIPDVEIVAIADEDEERGKSVASKYNTRFYRDYQELLKLEDVDFVIVCSENVKHKDMVIASAQAKRHILCEKPISIDIKSAKEMIETVNKYGVQLQTAFPVRFSPTIRRVKGMIDRGEFGRIFGFNCTNHGKMPGGWFVDKALAGGGAIMDHTVHVMDILRWYLGCEAQYVYAEGDTLLHNIPSDDVGLVSVLFENGVFATIDTSWSRPKSFPIWGDVNIYMSAEKGTVEIEVFNQNLSLYNDKTMSVSLIDWGSNMDFLMIKSFIDSIRENKPVEVTGYDGLKAMEVALAAYKSIELKEPVKLPLEG
ncbi:MAG: Gfo/Idh/MocA family protein [bacterium]